MEKTRKVVVKYSGRVQGVGFRATVRDIAENYDIAGEVCNVFDGTVLLEATGKGPELIAFLEAINQKMSRNIDNCHLEWLEADSGEFIGFSIVADKWG